MSAWAYCLDCTRTLATPTFVDAAVGLQKCAHCGAARPLDEFERRFVLDQAAEALHALSKMAAQAAESHGLNRNQWDQFAALFAPVD